MKKVFLVLMLLLLFSCSSIKEIDLTGTYETSEHTEEDGEIHGYYGMIEVDQISKENIFIYFFATRGFPSYNMGVLWDTLSLNQNIAIYHSEYDTNCTISFKFDNDIIEVNQNDISDLGCGFGHGVYARGIYKKTSSSKPEFLDLKRMSE